MGVITGSWGFYIQNDTTVAGTSYSGMILSGEKKKAAIEAGFWLHFNYKEYIIRAVALCFYVQTQPSVYKVKSCFIKPPKDKLSSAY